MNFQTVPPLSQARRLLLLACSSVLLADCSGSGSDESPELPLLAEKDREALESFYVTEAKRVDRKVCPTYAPGQHCGSCGLFKGHDTSRSGPCKTFPKQRVLSTGWCTEFDPKV